MVKIFSTDREKYSVLAVEPKSAKSFLGSSSAEIWTSYPFDFRISKLNVIYRGIYCVSLSLNGIFISKTCLLSYLYFMKALSSKFVAKSGIKWGLYEIFPTPAVLLLHPSGNIFLSWTIAYWSTLFNVLLKSWIVKITLNEDEEGVFFVRQSSSGTSGNFVHPGSLQRRG